MGIGTHGVKEAYNMLLGVNLLTAKFLKFGSYIPEARIWKPLRLAIEAEAFSLLNMALILERVMKVF